MSFWEEWVRPIPEVLLVRAVHVSEFVMGCSAVVDNGLVEGRTGIGCKCECRKWASRAPMCKLYSRYVQQYVHLLFFGFLLSLV